jgi:hypothetical protein
MRLYARTKTGITAFFTSITIFPLNIRKVFITGFILIKPKSEFYRIQTQKSISFFHPTKVKLYARNPAV